MRSLAFLLILTVAFLVGCSGGSKSLPKEHPRQGPKTAADSLCSFNVQFLGNSRLRRNQDLASFLADSRCDLVVVQELVSPPDLRLLPSSPHFGQSEPATFPDGTPHRPNERSTEFFLEMYESGFDQFWLSEEDTGTSEKNKQNSSATEWWVIFYKSDLLEVAWDLPFGFLSEKISANENFDRVPYAFSFRTKSQGFDFVLINVHLHPGASKNNRLRRQKEVQGILQWISRNRAIGSEKDFIVIGDMNFEDGAELDRLLLGTAFVSLNKGAATPTNTNPHSPKPYDHILIDPFHTKEIQVENNFDVLDLIGGMFAFWDLSGAAYPGQPYSHNLFRAYYSDHHPVRAQFNARGPDDD